MSLQQEINKDPLGGALGTDPRGTKKTGRQAGRHWGRRTGWETWQESADESPWGLLGCR